MRHFQPKFKSNQKILKIFSIVKNWLEVFDFGLISSQKRERAICMRANITFFAQLRSKIFLLKFFFQLKKFFAICTARATPVIFAEDVCDNDICSNDNDICNLFCQHCFLSNLWYGSMILLQLLLVGEVSNLSSGQQCLLIDMKKTPSKMAS